MSMESINSRTRRGWGLPIGALAAWGVFAAGATVLAYDHDRNHAPVRVDYDGPEVVVEDGAHLNESQSAANRCGESASSFTAQPEAMYVQPEDFNEIISYAFPLGDHISITEPNTCDSSEVVVDTSYVQPVSSG